MRRGVAISDNPHTGQSEAIHSPEAWASTVVSDTVWMSWSMMVVCSVAISCCPNTLRTMSSPLASDAYGCSGRACPIGLATGGFIEGRRGRDSTHLPPPVMIERAAIRALVTHLL